MKRVDFLKRGEREGVVGAEIEDKQRDFKNQKELRDFADQKRREIFPTANEHQRSGDSRYVYFPVVDHYFDRKPIIDTILIEKLKNGGRLLSVGVGSAKLEHLLYKGFELPKNAITLADISFSSEALKIDLERVVFDMREAWPKFAEKFDYILFPESFGVANFAPTQDVAQTSIRLFFEAMRKMLVVVQANADQNIQNNQWNEVKLLVEKDFPKIEKKYYTLWCAVHALAKGGELRLLGHLMTAEEVMYITMKCKEDFGEEIEVTPEPYLKIKLRNPQEVPLA